MLLKILFDAAEISTGVVDRYDLDIDDDDVYDVAGDPTIKFQKNGGEPIPATNSQIKKQRYDNIGITAAKLELIDQAKKECDEEIVPTYPLFKQHNVSALAHANPSDQIYVDERTFIDDYRGQCDTHETNIDAKTTTQQLADYVIDWTPPT